MSPRDAEAAAFLHSLGYLYMRSGQSSRSLVFLLIAYRIDTGHAGILRTLAAAFIANGAGERALGVIDRLVEVEGGVSTTVLLLRSRAHWAAGQHDEARRCFKTYVEMRREQ